MKKFKYLVLFAAISGVFASCSKEESFDAQAQFAADTTAIRSYVRTNSIPVLKIEQYGLFYQIIAPGTGDVDIKPTTNVTVDYAGKVLGGSTNFDSSNGKPVTFLLGQLIPGWQIGIPLIQKGGKIRLFIPSYYAYGNSPKQGIPANSVLDFTIELTNVQ